MEASDRGFVSTAMIEFGAEPAHCFRGRDAQCLFRFGDAPKPAIADWVKSSKHAIAALLV